MASSPDFTDIVAGSVTDVLWSEGCQIFELGPIVFLRPCDSLILCLERLRTEDTFAEPVEGYTHQPGRKRVIIQLQRDGTETDLKATVEG